MNGNKQVQTVCTGVASDTTCITLQQGSTKASGADIGSIVPTSNLNFANGEPVLYASDWTYGGTPGETRALLEYNLSQIPQSTVIVSAALNLFAADSDAAEGYNGEPTYGSANACYLNQVTSAWSPSTVTWNTQPTASSTGQVLLAQSTNLDESYFNLNITSMVQSWVNTPSTNYGMLLQMVTVNYYNSMIFCSTSYIDPSQWPKLQVCYLAPGSSFTASTDFTTAAPCITQPYVYR